MFVLMFRLNVRRVSGFCLSFSAVHNTIRLLLYSPLYTFDFQVHFFFYTFYIQKIVIRAIDVTIVRERQRFRTKVKRSFFVHDARAY